MANKGLNDALDAHMSKVKGADPLLEEKTPKLKKPRVRKEHFPTFRRWFKRTKEYFFPSVEFQYQEIDDNSPTIVERIDKGIYAHIHKIQGYFSSKKEMKRVEQEYDPEPEDVDMSQVQEVMRNNKLK